MSKLIVKERGEGGKMNLFKY